jgi:hypothetical protein
MKVLSFALWMPLLVGVTEAFTAIVRRESCRAETRQWMSTPDTHGVLEPYTHFQMLHRGKENTPSDGGAIAPLHDTRQWSAPTVAAPSGLVLQGMPPLCRTPPPAPQWKGHKFIIETPVMNKPSTQNRQGGHKTPPLVSSLKQGLVGVQGGAPATSNLHYPGDQAKDDSMEPFCISLREQSFGEWSDVE